jgi:hypothetical protein
LTTNLQNSISLCAHPLDTSAEVLAAVAEVDVLVLVEAVGILDGALVLSSLPLVVTEKVEESGFDARLLQSALVEVRVRTLVEVVAAVTAGVELLAALDVGAEAGVVLGLASVGTGAGLLVAAVRRARVGVGVGVELEGVLREVVLQVVAGNKRQLNTTNGVARTVTPDAGARLLADVGRLRSTRGGRNSSSAGSAGSSTGVDAGGSLDIVTARGVVTLEAAGLAAAATTRARRGAVSLNTVTPLGEVEAVESTGPASVLEARGDVLGTVVVGGLATALVLEVGDRGSTPVTALVLAGVGDDDCRSTQRSTAGGGARSCHSGGRVGRARRVVCAAGLTISTGRRRVGRSGRVVCGRLTVSTSGGRVGRTRRGVVCVAGSSAHGGGRAGRARDGAGRGDARSSSRATGT